MPGIDFNRLGAEIPMMSRRTMLQAGSLGLLGLGMNHFAALRAADVVSRSHGGGTAKSVIFVFLSEGLTQHDSFDPKPDAPADIRGEFSAVATQTPGVRICEHLPMIPRPRSSAPVCKATQRPRLPNALGELDGPYAAC